MTPAKPAGGEKIKVSNASQVPFRSGIVEITTGASRERIRIEDRDDVNNELTVADNGRGADGTKAIGHAVGDGVSVPDQFFVADDVAVNANAWAPGCLTTAFVFSTAQTFLTTGGAQPTAAAVDSALVARAATVGAQHKKQRCTNPGGAASCANISQKEVDTISYVSGKAGTGAQVAGEAVFQAFGGLELSFVIGGHFAIGNNDTVAKIVDTVLEVVTRRAVEHATYLVLESSAVEVTVP
jgi:hypothetical protein